MSWKDQTRRRRAAEKRGRRGNRRAGAMLLRQVLGPVQDAGDLAIATGFVVDDLAVAERSEAEPISDVAEEEAQPRVDHRATGEGL